MSLTPRHFEPLLLLVVLGCAMALPVRADLAGDTIRTWELYPDLSTIYGGPVDVVDPGTILSFPGFAPIVNITFDDSNITITMVRDATAFTSAFNGFRFFDVSEPGFGSVALDSATNVPGIDGSRVSFDAQDIFVNFSGVTYSTGQEVSLDIAPVPEPRFFFLLPVITVLLISIARGREKPTRYRGVR